MNKNTPLKIVIYIFKIINSLQKNAPIQLHIGYIMMESLKHFW